MAVGKNIYYRTLSADADTIELRLSDLENEPVGRSSPERLVDSLLAKSQDWLASRLNLAAHAAVMLDLGIPPGGSLLSGYELVSYATVFAERVKAATGVQFSSMQIAKHSGDSTRLAVGEAVRCARPVETAAAKVQTRRSYATPAFQHDLTTATPDIRELARKARALRLHLSYLTGLPRTWSRLWVPTLAGIFGEAPSDKASATSSRVVLLQLDHLSAGESLGHMVHMEILASDVPDHKFTT